MDLFTEATEKVIQSTIIHSLKMGNEDRAALGIETMIDRLYNAIPEKKRISYGVYYTITVLGRRLYQLLSESNAGIKTCAAAVFWSHTSSSDRGTVQGTALQILAFWAVNTRTAIQGVFPFFESSAASEVWELREHASGIFRKIIARHPEDVHVYLSGLSCSENARLRRFASETLRPVVENRRFLQNHEYSISILRNLFREPCEYPRKSVGNNLSDLSRKLPEPIFSIVHELVSSGDKNSYRIAYRACRNLVMQDHHRVLDALEIEEYRYKNRLYRR